MDEKKETNIAKLALQNILLNILLRKEVISIEEAKNASKLIKERLDHVHFDEAA